MLNYRPSKWDEYFGQKNIIDNLKVYVKASSIRNKTLDHIMIIGNSGMGKTSLAFLISKILKTRIIILNGASLQKPSDIISILTTLKEGNLLFIDEIHAISKEVMEVLYPVLEENKLNIIIGKEYNSKSVTIDLPKFTLIGATTNIEKLSTPFINRFPILFQMENYTDDEIGMIAKHVFTVEKVSIESESLDIIAHYSRSIPRNAINISKRIIDFAVCENREKITQSLVNKYLRKMNYFEDGLTKNDLIYLKTMFNNTTMGLDSISQITTMSSSYLLNFIEPHLLRKGYIIRTHKGRKITQKGQEKYKKISSIIETL